MMTVWAAIIYAVLVVMTWAGRKKRFVTAIRDWTKTHPGSARERQAAEKAFSWFGIVEHDDGRRRRRRK